MKSYKQRSFSRENGYEIQLSEFGNRKYSNHNI